MTTPNWRNRTLWTGDNPDIMRGMNSESVDLIYLDPPFNSNRKLRSSHRLRGSMTTLVLSEIHPTHCQVNP